MIALMTAHLLNHSIATAPLSNLVGTIELRGIRPLT
jgi:hypothetical protein